MLTGNDTVTIYNYLGEDGTGAAIWKRTILYKVDAIRYDGIQQYVGRALEGKDHLSLYIHAKLTYGDNEYVPPNKFDIYDNEGLYTLNVNGKDMIMLGESYSDAPIEGYGTYRILTVQDNRMAKTEMLQHIKAVCA